MATPSGGRPQRGPVSADISDGDYFKNHPVNRPSRPGAWVTPTAGEPWPKPKLVKPNGDGNFFSVVDAKNFEFKVRTSL